MNITVEYKDKVNTALDERIKAAMEAMGAEWYAQGFNFHTRVRDIAFLLDAPQQ